MPTTLVAVARAAGVATSTASRALQNHPALLPETIARVKAAAERLGYRPNPLVRSLMTQVRSGRVDDRGLCLAYLDMGPTRDFWTRYAVTRKFYHGARARAAELGYAFTRFQPAAEGFSRRRLDQMLRTRAIRGVLLSVYVEHEPKRLSLADFPLDLSGISSVAIGGEYIDPAVHFASNNQYMGGRLVARRLRELGYRRPGLVIEPKVDRGTDARFQSGFFSLDWPRVDMPVPMLFAKPGEEAAFAAWWRAHRPDCVVANFPYVHDWLGEMRVRVPRDCAFVVLDWEEARPDLAGLDQHSDQVAAAGVDLLVAQLDRNELGYPSSARGVFLEGSWRDGLSAPPRAA